MEANKPESIKTLGLIIAAVAGLIVLCNAMAAIGWSITGIGDEINGNQPEEPDAFWFVLNHYVEMCLIVVAIGALFLLGGLFIRKYRLWANRLVTALSVLMIIVIWVFMISIATTLGPEIGVKDMGIGAIFGAVFWSTPLGLLIWFLNKKSSRIHFA